MLWRKESKNPDAVYTDIFAHGGISALNKMFKAFMKIDHSQLRKSNIIALQKQKAGNVQFGESNWKSAMELYNESLCYAEKGSEIIGISYGSRAKCFFEMKLYNESLKDIGLAKEAGYPAQMMIKLEQLETKCQKCIQQGRGRILEHAAKLSFEAHEQFPCLANVLDIQRDVDGNYSVVAKEDLDVGQTIVVEDALKSIHLGYGERCNICLKSMVNLIPCEKCTVAMFCSTECRHHFFHEYECGMKLSNTELNGTVFRNNRGILSAIDMFSSVDELMDFVEQTIESGQNELPESLLDPRSKYRVFLKLRTGPEIANQELISMAINEFNAFLKYPKIGAMFNTKKYHRFLMHLVTQHIWIGEHNSKAFQRTTKQGTTHKFFSTCGVMARYFNHSCAPNVDSTLDDVGNEVYLLVRPVKKGEEVLISWLPFPFQCPTKQRKQMLREEKSLNCDCLRCIGAEANEAFRHRINNHDANFRSIESLYVELHEKQGYDPKSQQLMQKCVEFLQKYGELDWCEEIEKAILAFLKSYRMQFQ